MALPRYKLSYLEIKRLFLQYPVIKEAELIDENKIDKINVLVKLYINNAYTKEKILKNANQYLLNYIKETLKAKKPPYPYDYTTLLAVTK